MEWRETGGRFNFSFPPNEHIIIDLFILLFIHFI